MIPKSQLIEETQHIVEALTALRSDESVPKNVKIKIDEILATVRDENDIPLRVSKSLHMLDEISEDLNLQSFIRTQVWNISSMFEKLNNA